MGVIVPQPSLEDRTAGGQRIDGSTRFNGDHSHHLTRTPSASNRKTWTLSLWVKMDGGDVRESDGTWNRGAFLSSGSNPWGGPTIWSDGILTSRHFAHAHDPSGTDSSKRCIAVCRDFSSWYHVVYTTDTTQDTDTNRWKIYVNGELQSLETPSGLNGYPDQNTDLGINAGAQHYIGTFTNTSAYFDGELSQYYFIDGQALDASYFGYTDPLTGTWRPKEFSGSYTKESYNIARTWSGSSTNITNASNAFNGKTAAGSGDCYANAGADSDGYWDLPVNIVATKVECYIDPAHTGVTGAKFYARDTGSTQYTYTTSSVSGDSGWVEIPLGGATRTINRVGCIRNSGGSGSALFAWRVTNTDSSGTIVTNEILIDNLNGTGINSFYLPLDGSAPIGQDQSGIKNINDGTTWSNRGNWSGTSSTGTLTNASGNPLTAAFDGDLSTSFAMSVAGGMIWTPPTPISFSSRIEIYIDNGLGVGIQGYVATISGSQQSHVDLTLADTWGTIYSGSGTLDKLQIALGTGSGNGNLWITALRIDGIIVLDNMSGNSWRPVNFGSASVDKATGALPILNTTQGGMVAIPGARGNVGVAVTVYNDGGGNKYYLDGEQAGTVKFAPGQTVTFDTGDSTVSGHPFRLSGLSDGTHHGTTLYSVDFDGTDDQIYSDAYSTDYWFDGDFTLEYFCYPDVDPDGKVTVEFAQLASSDSGTAWQIYHTNYKPRLWTTGANVAGTVSMTQSVWNHVVFCRKGNNLMSFVNGQTSIVDTTYAADIGGADTDNRLNIGCQWLSGPQNFFNGKISNLRIVKGTCLYTQDFAPPVAPLTNVSGTTVLCCQSSSVTGATVLPSGHALTSVGTPSASTDAPKTFTSGVVTGAISEGTAGAATTITVPTNAPSDLYYYCTNHSGMGGAVSIGATDPNVADPYAWKNVWASITGDRQESGTEATDETPEVNCTITARKTITLTGGIPESSDKSVFYGRCLYYDGTGDSLAMPSDSDMDFGTGDFTIEGWFYPTDITHHRHLPLIHNGNSAANNYYDWRLYFNNHGSGDSIVWFEAECNGTNIVVESKTIIASDRWFHVAVTRESGVFKLFMNGVLEDTDTRTSNPIDTDRGSYIEMGYGNLGSAGGCFFKGYEQDWRIYKGVAKYKENFIPASTLPDILPETPSGVAYASELTQATAGSVNFNGSTDKISVLDSTDWDFDGDFTIECWAYIQSTGNKVLVCKRADTNVGPWTLYTNGSILQFVATTDGSSYQLDLNGPSIGLKRWHHLAVTRSGTTVKLWVDGASDTTAGTLSGTTHNDSTVLTIGSLADSTQEFEGYISNLRIVKGTAVYTEPFTPPTGPLTNITNTKLLCCQDTKLAGAAAVSPLVTGGLNNGRVWSAHGRWQFAGDSHSGKSNGDPIIWHASGPGNQMFNGAEGAGSNATYPSPNGAIAWYCDIPCSTSFRVKTNQAQQPGDVTITTDSGTASATLPGTGNASASGQVWTTVTLPGSTTKITKIQFPHDEASGWVDIGAIEVDGTNLTDPVSPYILKGQNNYTKTVAGSCEGELIATSFNPFDKDIHTVRGQEAQYATLSPINTMNTSATFSDGNLRAQITGPCTVASSIPMVRGKWYAEFINTAHGSTHMGIGISKIECCDGARQIDECQHRGGWGLWHISGDGSYKRIGYGASWGSQSSTWNDWGQIWGAANTYDVMGLALDMDNRTLTYYKNGQNMGTNENGLTKTLNWGVLIDAANDNGTILPNTSWADGDHGMVFVISNGQSGATSDFDVNFGQRPWKYAPPSGFQGATLANCYARPTLVRPDKEYFAPVLWTGTGAAKQIDLGFQPDLVWIKDRSTSNNYDMRVFDSIRGMKGETSKALYLDTTDAEATNNSGASNNDGALTANATGFLISTSGDRINKNTSPMVAYGWKAGGNKGTWNVDGEDRGSASAAGLTAGDTSVLTGCSINTKAGFSIVTYTQDSGGASKNIAHGLSKAPSFVIMKHVNNSSSWYTVHTGIENVGKILYTDSNSDQDTSSDFGGAWPGTTYTATATTGVNGRQLVLYSWTNTKGVQWFGQYEGNGDSSKGVYVNLGFKPAMLWIKRTDSSGDWYLWDNKRETINPRQNIIKTNNYHGEDSTSTVYLDFLDDGFKLYNTAGDVNNNGSKYLYMAWAETPTFNLYA